MEGRLHFPRLVAETLSGHSLVLPDSLEKQFAVVALAFRRHAQASVDSWFSPVARAYNDCDRVTYYEIPLIAGGWRMMSGFIDSGMRAGIPAGRHDHVATYYGGTDRLRGQLEIHDLETAHIYLIDQNGAVLWNASGWATAKRLNELHGRVAELIDRGDDDSIPSR